MPGSSLRLASAAFTNGLKASLTCPDRTGLIGEYLLRENATRSIRNTANPAVPATLLGAGTPVYNANSVLLSGSASYGNGIAGLDTNIPNPADMTLILVRKKLTQGNLASSIAVVFGGGSNFNGMLENTGWNFYNNQSGVPPGVSSVAAPTDLDFHFAAGTGANGDKGTMYVATGGVMSSNQGAVNGSVKSGTATIKLCSVAANYQLETAYAAVYNRVLTAAQVTACYDTLKAYFASRSVVVS